MGKKAEVSAITEALIHAYNKTESTTEKTRILSAFVPSYPNFKMLDRFNPPKLGNTGNEHDDDDDDGIPLTLEESLELPHIGVMFKERVTRYKFDQGTNHIIRHLHGGSVR